MLLPRGSQARILTLARRHRILATIVDLAKARAGGRLWFRNSLLLTLVPYKNVW
eukprot:COSAG05_NODE_2365_length_3171_cov_3.659831_1_plen_53_part_10